MRLPYACPTKRFKKKIDRTTVDPACIQPGDFFAGQENGDAAFGFCT